MGDTLCKLRVEQADRPDRVKLVWTIRERGDDWEPPPYQISRGALDQASNTVREVLRRIPMDMRSLSDQHYADLLQELALDGEALADNLFDAADGDRATADDIRESVRNVAEAGQRCANRADLHICLSDETVHVPWGFAFDGNRTRLLQCNNRTIADFVGFWLTSFRLTARFQGGPKLKPATKSACSVYALHEDLFAQARNAMRHRHPGLETQLSELLGTALPGTNWRDCERNWRSISEDCDSILYVFGHSDGEHIVLADGKDGSEYVLPASSFKTRFGKDKKTRSASICIFNGCCTAAPASTRPWPVGFLSATHSPGFFGFVGTETEVRNDLASEYGAKLLWRLCHEGQSLGDAFDALQQDSDLYPLSLLYSCFANRNFRLPMTLVSSVPEVAHAA